jgi:aryl-alcohol dehydrogenase-like predicted oxidoreductase
MHRSAPPLKIPRIALGCMGFGSSAWRPWVLDEPDALAVLARALEAGVTFFDTANVYCWCSDSCCAPPRRATG